MNKSFKSTSSDMEGDYQYNTQFRSYPSGVVTEYPIFGVIGDASNYVQLLRILLSAQESDTIILQINSCGGSVDTTLMILNAMKKCKATIVSEVYGICCSCATWILLASDRMVINEDIEFMIHNYSTGDYGKGGDVTTSIAFTDARIKKIMLKIYKGFLTEDELNDVFKGVDIYFTDSELTARLQKFAKYKNEANKEDNEVYYTLKRSYLDRVIHESDSRDDVIPAIEAYIEENM